MEEGEKENQKKEEKGDHDSEKKNVTEEKGDTGREKESSNENKVAVRGEMAQLEAQREGTKRDFKEELQMRLFHLEQIQRMEETN